MNTDIRLHQAWFADFTQGYRLAESGDCGPIDLKIAHTDRVLCHAQHIVQEHEFAPLLARATVLAALYHDVGRFPQYARWHTFKDSLSTNHGLLGVKTLKTHKALAAEDAVLRTLVLAAVGLHNRFALSPSLSASVRQVTHAVRDADKCDIIRIMAEELAKSGPVNKTVMLHVVDDPDLWTPKVVDDILAGRVAGYPDLRSINDFCLLLASWLYDLHFRASHECIRSSGYIEQLLAHLPPHPKVQAARQKLLALLGTPA